LFVGKFHTEDDAVEFLVAAPSGLLSGFAIVFAAQKAAQFGEFSEEFVDCQLRLFDARAFPGLV